MAGNNQFYPFAISVSAQLLNQNTWADDSTASLRRVGQPFNSPAYAQLWNKALRQATLGAAGTAQYIANQNIDVEDNDFTLIGNSFGNAIQTQTKAELADLVSDKVQEGVLLDPAAAHNVTTNRSSGGAHPISAINGLADELKTIQDAIIEFAERLPNSSTEVKGISTIATELEVFSGENDTKFVTPYTLGRRIAQLDQLPELSADKITSLTFDKIRIPNLPASQFTTGVFTTDRIPELDASKFVSGTFSNSRIPPIDISKIGDLAASQFTSGVFSISRIPDLPASIVTSGTISESRIPGLPASKFNSSAVQFDADRLPEIITDWKYITESPSDNTDLDAALDSKEDLSNKVSTISSSSTDSQYPTVKVTKEYLDSLIPERTWGNITGTLSSQTDLNTLLTNKLNKNANIPSGIKTKVTYDSTGRITGGSLITADDIPNLPVTKITGKFTEEQISVSYTDKYNTTPKIRPYGSYNSLYTDENNTLTLSKNNVFYTVGNYGRIANNIMSINGENSSITFVNDTDISTSTLLTYKPQLSGFLYNQGNYVNILPGGQTIDAPSDVGINGFVVKFAATGILDMTPDSTPNSMIIAIKLILHPPV